MTVTEAKALLEISEDAALDYELAKQKYHRAVLKYHPDRGGDRDQFELMRQAYGRLLMMLDKCPECKGRRKIKETKSFWFVTKPCPRCTGIRPKE